MFLLITSACILYLIFELMSFLGRLSWGWRTSIMMTSLVWGSIVVGLTELLSMNQNLDSFSLAIGWGIVLITLFGVLSWLVIIARPKLPNLLQVRKILIDWIKQHDRGEWGMLGLLGLQAFLLLVVALAYAPNTYESMTYHLPRVMHWLQNGSLANFAVSNVRDIYFPPFAEFVFLHQIVLAGSDHYVNIVQWSAFLLCLIGVSAVAAELGAQRDTQFAAALLCAGIPMAVLQATAARNDLVIAFWLLSLVWFGLRWGRQPASWLWAVGAGLSLGLAILTKATSFVYALPLGIMIGIFVMKNGGIRLGVIRGGFVLLLALSLNLGHLGRNWGFYSNPIGIHERVRNDIMTPAVFVSNTIRNVALHVPTDCKPPLDVLNQAGRWLLGGLESLHSLTGLSPSDPRTTWGYVDIFNRSLGCLYDETYSGNPFHALLIFCTCLCLPFLRSASPITKWFGLALLVAFGLLNTTLRWQVWGSHLQLPLFILWTPILAITLSLVRRPELSRITALFAVILSFLWIYNNQLRPLSGLVFGSIPPRDEQYFQTTIAYYPEYNSMTELITQTGCDRVGLNITSLAMEYPIWVLLREKGFDGVIYYIDVTNETRVFEDPEFIPCAIISEGKSSNYAAILTEHSFGNFYVYLNEANGNSSDAH